MKIFLDANILVAVLNKEYPAFPAASRVLSLAGHSKYTVYTTAICLAIAFYFAEKKHGTVAAKSKMKLLSAHLQIAECGAREVQMAAADKEVGDFEDGLEYYAALHAGCACIITEDSTDFHFSRLPVCNAELFLKQYVLPLRH